MNTNIMLNQDEFYHVTGSLLKAGSVLLPSSYGIILKERYGMFQESNCGNPLTILYEKELEEYRLKNYTDKPSRFGCIFLCHSYDNMMNFIQKTGRFFQFGYKVRLTDPSAKYHISDWERYDTRWAREDVRDWARQLQQSVREYWEGIPQVPSDVNSPVEILTESPVEIVKRVF